LTAALCGGQAYRVHGLDADAGDIQQAREFIRSSGLYGPVSVEHFDGPRLPYGDNLVNLLIADELGQIPMREVMRVLVPRGVAYVKRGNTWRMDVKPRPENTDEWTHFLHDASGNAVAHDEVVGPPRYVSGLPSRGIRGATNTFRASTLWSQLADESSTSPTRGPLHPSSDLPNGIL